jgi:chemotaxis protein histidine kinase CheA
MFGLGEDSKDDKLKKNMEDIKDMIEGQNKESATNTENAQETKQKKSPRQRTDGGKQIPETPPPPSQEETQTPTEQEPTKESSGVQQYKKPESGLRGVGNKKPGKEQTSESEKQQDMQTNQDTQKTDTSPGPKSEGSQLFIRKQRFRQVMEMIGEMRELSNEMKRMTDNLQKGLDKDKKTSQDLENLNQKMSSYNQKIESEVSPDEQ